jgi:hypothetical protein
VKADTVDLAQVFGMTVRYEVPLFQRPYVWEREKQWQPLWDDIKAVAVRQIDDTAANDSTPHFIGAIAKSWPTFIRGRTSCTSSTACRQQVRPTVSRRHVTTCTALS